MAIRCFCLETRFYCTGCNQSFELAELYRQLDGDDFETLSELVADRLSDRV